ncbi:type I restriction enzyme S subunit [Pseudoalteromonas sp. MBR-15]|jgi:type I restriction enzyme S subunit
MWQKIPLKELYNVRSSKRVLKSQWQNSGVPFYRGREITKLSKNGFINNELYITEELYSEFKSKHGVPIANDIMITAIGTIGNSYVVKKSDKFYFKDASVLWLERKSEVNSAYINLWLSSTKMKDQLDEGNGATVDTLTIKKLQSLIVDIPPLNEQERIVDTLEQAFTNIDKARATVDRNLENARKLYESYLQQIFNNSDGSWVTTSLGKITGGVFTGPFGSLLHKSDYIKNGTPLVNPAHITPSGIVPDFNKTVSKETLERLSSYIMQVGDIVISRRGEMGRCALISQNESGYLCGTGSFFIRASSAVDGKYLLNYLSSEVCKARLEKIAGGAVMPNLSNSDLSNLSINLPPIQKQKEYAAVIQKLHSEIEQVKSIYLKKLNALDELKKSVLQKAFNGELTNSKGAAA